MASDAWREANKDRIQAYGRDWRARRVDYLRTWRAANLERRREYNRKWDAENRERKREIHREWSARHPEIRKKKCRDWHTKNHEYALRKQKAYREDNPGRMNALSAKKRAAKRKATPPWLTTAHKAGMLAIYESAEPGFHVDHIAPLRGNNSCGLHVPWNLQILTEEDNLRKGNRELNCFPAWPHALDHEPIDFFGLWSLFRLNEVDKPGADGA